MAPGLQVRRQPRGFEHTQEYRQEGKRCHTPDPMAYIQG